MENNKQKTNRNAVVMIRLTNKEKQQLQEKAMRIGQSNSSYIRSVLSGRKPVDLTTRKSLIGNINQQFRVLHGIGNNINQLTHSIHLIRKGFKIHTNEIQQLDILLSYNLRMLREIKNTFSALLTEITRN